MRGLMPHCAAALTILALLFGVTSPSLSACTSPPAETHKFGYAFYLEAIPKTS